MEIIHVTSMQSAPITLDRSPADANQGFMETAISVMVSSIHMIIPKKTSEMYDSSQRTVLRKD